MHNSFVAYRPFIMGELLAKISIVLQLESCLRALHAAIATYLLNTCNNDCSGASILVIAL